MKKQLALLVPVLCLALGSIAAKADTLQLIGGTNNPSGGSEQIYPYSFNVTTPAGTSVQSLMCLNFNREITAGESWTASERSIPLGNAAATDVDYRAIAILYSKVFAPGADISDIQYAEWSILDPSGVAGNPLFDANAMNLAGNALTAANSANDGGLISSGFFNQFTLYIPSDDSAAGPQEFIGLAATPEPSSLVLLGSGLVGMAGMVRRKLVRG